MKTETPILNRSLALVALLFGLSGAWRAEAEVVLQWKFDGAKEAGEWQGKVGKAQAAGEKLSEGPRAPRYPSFDGKNRAGAFENKESFLVVKDQERGGPANLKFGLGETIGDLVPFDPAAFIDALFADQ